MRRISRYAPLCAVLLFNILEIPRSPLNILSKLWGGFNKWYFHVVMFPINFFAFLAVGGRIRSGESERFIEKVSTKNFFFVRMSILTYVFLQKVFFYNWSSIFKFIPCGTVILSLMTELCKVNSVNWLQFKIYNFVTSFRKSHQGIENCWILCRRYWLEMQFKI